MAERIGAWLDDGGRLTLQHGPITLLVRAQGTAAAERRALEAATARFDGLLQELVDELDLLRSPMTPNAPEPQGPVARRMDRAVRAHARDVFVTRMAAVAGAVADEILTVMTATAPLSRAYVNNGGDIALSLASGQSFRIAMADIAAADLGRIEIGHGEGIGGIATSGRHGRSLSLGIADSVTVLAETAAAADAAATLIANAVDLPEHGGIRRERADMLHPDSDLGARLAVTKVPALSPGETDCALDAGQCRAEAMRRTGRIIGAALFLNGRSRTTGTGLPGRKTPLMRMHHA